MIERARRILFAALSAAAVTAVMVSFTATDATAQEGPSVVGDWEGVLSAMGTELTVVFHITQGEDGALAATLDSPDQGAFGIPCEAPAVDGLALTIPVAAVQGGYEGKVAEDGSAIEGTWTQGPNSLPLKLTPVVDDEG